MRAVLYVQDSSRKMVADENDLRRTYPGGVSMYVRPKCNSFCLLLGVSVVPKHGETRDDEDGWKMKMTE